MCWFKQLKDPRIHLPICGISTSSQKLTKFLAYFQIAIFSGIAICFKDYACPATASYQMAFFWIPALIGICMALVIFGIYIEHIYLLIPGAVTYVLMLGTLLMVIFITGAFTIFPQDGAKYIGWILDIDATQPSARTTLRIISFLCCLLSAFSVQIPLTGYIALAKLWIEVAHRNKVLHSMHLQTLDDDCCGCIRFAFP